MKQAGWAKKKYLVDGFPRNQENLDGWNEAMGAQIDFPCMLHFVVTEETMMERCLERGQTSGRIDDNTESLKKRFNQYKTE